MSDGAFGLAVVGDQQLADFIRSATERLVVVAPAVSDEVAVAITAAAQTVSGEIAVILDTDPEVYRLGYGDPQSLAILERTAATNTCIVLRRQPGIRLCVVITDGRTLICAPTPRFIEAGPNTSAGANAIVLGNPPAALERDLGAGQERPRIGAEPLSREDIEAVQSDLAQNPPQRFDIARRMRVFNAHYEFVELELTGIHIDRRRIRIPEHLMGVADERTRARLRSHFQLVDDDSQLSGNHLRKDRDIIARKYLKTVLRFGNLVRRDDKPALVAEVEDLRRRVDAFRRELEAKLEASIDRSRHELAKALLPAVIRRPPKEWRTSEGVKPDRDTCRLFVEQDLERAFGSVAQWLSGMEVRLQFKGITYETLTSSEFLDAAEKARVKVRHLLEEFDAARGTPAQQSSQQPLFG